MRRFPWLISEMRSLILRGLPIIEASVGAVMFNENSGANISTSFFSCERCEQSLHLCSGCRERIECTPPGQLSAEDDYESKSDCLNNLPRFCKRGAGFSEQPEHGHLETQ